MTETHHCQIVKLDRDFAVVKLPDGILAYAPKTNFVEISVNLGHPSSDLTRLFNLGQSIVVRSLFELQKPTQGCRLIADEWGADWGEEVGEGGAAGKDLSEESLSLGSDSVMEDGSASSGGTHRKRPAVAAGFIHYMKPSYAIVYAMHRGFVFCGNTCFESMKFWESVGVGCWVVVSVVSQTEKQGCHYRATRVTRLTGPPEPPIHIWKDPGFDTWVTHVRCLIGVVKASGGSAWSPQVGRIHIRQKHIAGFHTMEDGELEVYLAPKPSQEWNHSHWLTTGNYACKVLDDPWDFLRRFPSLRLVRASVSKLNPHGFGFMNISSGIGRPLESGASRASGSGVFFSAEDLEAWKPGQNISEIIDLGSEWDVFVHPQQGPVKDQGRNPYKALAIFPMGSVKVPSDHLGAIHGGLETVMGRDYPRRVESSSDEGEERGEVGFGGKKLQSVKGKKKVKVDKECQTEDTVEAHLARSIMSDAECVKAIALKMPDLVHEMVKLRL